MEALLTATIAPNYSTTSSSSSLLNDNRIVERPFDRKVVCTEDVLRVWILAVARPAPKVHLRVDANERRNVNLLVDSVVLRRESGSR